MPLKVLLVESESKSPYSIREDLLARGDQLVIVPNPGEAPSIAVSDWPDLIVLNACTGLTNVKEVCRALDDTFLELPRLVVYRDELGNHSSGDVSLLVPFTSRQLTQRIKKALGDQNNRFLRVGDVTLDLLKRQVQRSGRSEHLTPKGSALLHLLMQHPHEVLTRRAIMKNVWDTEYLGDTRTLDVHVRWLRECLEDDPSRPHYIITVRGVGYRFDPEGD